MTRQAQGRRFGLGQRRWERVYRGADDIEVGNIEVIGSVGGNSTTAVGREISAGFDGVGIEAVGSMIEGEGNGCRRLLGHDRRRYSSQHVCTCQNGRRLDREFSMEGVASGIREVYFMDREVDADHFACVGVGSFRYQGDAGKFSIGQRSGWRTRRRFWVD